MSKAFPLTVFVCLLATCLSALCAQETAEIRPSRSDLRVVPLPELSVLEEAVKVQIGEVQKKLRSAVATSEITDEQLSEAYGLAGRVYQAYGFVDSAESCYLNAVVLRPSNFAWSYYLARLYQEEGEVNQALTWYRRSQDLRQDYPALFVNLGNLNLELNELELAEAAFNRALQINGEDPAALFGLGLVHIAREEYEKAIVELKAVQNQVPQANRLHYSLAMAYRELGEAEKAQYHLERMGPVGIRTLDPLMDGLEEMKQGERAHLLRGRRAYAAGDYQAAAESFRQAVEAEPNSARALINLGSALAKIGDWDKSIGALKKALLIEPENSNAHFNLGSIFVSIGKVELAVMHLRQVLSVDPNDSEAEMKLARAYYRLGLDNEALQHFSQILERDSSHEEALLEKAGILIDRGEFEQTLELLGSVVRQSPTSDKVAFVLARLLAASPDPKLRDGRRALQIATDLYETLPSAWHAETIALALAALNRCSEAVRWLEKAEQMGREGSAKEAFWERMAGRLNGGASDLSDCLSEKTVRQIDTPELDQ